MASLNSCSFTGRAGRDPELRYTNNGNSIAQFSIAIDGYKRDEKPLWLQVTIWGKQAETAANYVHKGDMVGVSGRLEEERWTDKTSGEERSRIILNAQSLTLLEGKPRDEQPAPAPAPARQARRQAPQPQQAWESQAADEGDDFLPF